MTRFFYMPHGHGTDSFTSPPEEGMLRIFMLVKIQRLRPGLNPQTWVPEASMLTTRPPKPSQTNTKCPSPILWNDFDYCILRGTFHSPATRVNISNSYLCILKRHGLSISDIYTGVFFYFTGRSIECTSIVFFQRFTSCETWCKISCLLFSNVRKKLVKC